jgi:hypothetical protein
VHEGGSRQAEGAAVGEAKEDGVWRSGSGRCWLGLFARLLLARLLLALLLLLLLLP